MENSKIIFFDGECNLCNRSVQFIIKRDSKGVFKFASQASEIGEKLIKQYRIPGQIDSIILVDENRIYLESDAVLRICKDLDGLWKLLSIFLIIPKRIRNMIYQVVAKNRHKWFSNNESSCMLPSPDMKKRFL